MKYTIKDITQMCLDTLIGHVGLHIIDIPKDVVYQLNTYSTCMLYGSNNNKVIALYVQYNNDDALVFCVVQYGTPWTTYTAFFVDQLGMVHKLDGGMKRLDEIVQGIKLKKRAKGAEYILDI